MAVRKRSAIPRGVGVRLGEYERPLSEERTPTVDLLGDALKRRRKELGFTQETASKYCGHSARVIGEIERGKRTAQLGVALDYAEFLGVEIHLKVRGGAMRRLNVFREYHGSYELVGSIADSKSNGPRFSYDSGYLATPNATAISRSLPLVGESLPPKAPGRFSMV